MEETDVDHDAHIYTSASETGYEPVDHDIHTIHEEGEEEDMLDNLAYGKTENGGSEAIRLSEFQCEAAVELKGNQSYNLAPTTSVYQDEGEYSYPASSIVSPTD